MPGVNRPSWFALDPVMRPCRLILVVLASAVLAACAHAPPPTFALPFNADEPYRLDTGDRLRIVVFGQEGLTSTYAVDTAGKITMTLIGAVTARGLTTAGLQQAITARLREGYIREPKVAVEIDQYRPFFVLGEVTIPGQYPYVPDMGVEKAVAIAGGYTPRAYRYQVEIHRQVDGVIVHSAVPPNCPVRPGDVVVVAERWF
jgi:polysaccharide export outer membrane protein